LEFVDDYSVNPVYVALKISQISANETAADFDMSFGLSGAFTFELPA